MISLDGKRVVVTRSSDDGDSLASALESRGAIVIRLPTIAIEYPEDLADAAATTVEDLRAGAFEWLVFSSRPGVVALLKALSRHSVERVVLRQAKVAVVGAATKAFFQETTGRDPDVVPPRFTAADVAGSIGEGQGRVLLPRPETAPRTIVDELAARGWDPVEVALYRTVRGNPEEAALRQVRAGDFDVVTFSSGSTVRFFDELVGSDAVSEGHKTVVIGPSTEGVARELGYRIDAVADPHTTEGLLSAVERVVGR